LNNNPQEIKIMILILKRSAIFAASIYLLACSSVQVYSEYDHSASFAQYKTYTLAPSAEKIALSPASEAVLRDTLRTGLVTRGLIEVSENPDIHVVPHLSTQEKETVYQTQDTMRSDIPYGWGNYGVWDGAPSTYTDVYQYTEGTLILDFVDVKTQKLVFRGIGKGTVSTQEANAERIREVVNKIVQEYPGVSTH
jgi:hypothetical protein